MYRTVSVACPCTRTQHIRMPTNCSALLHKYIAPVDVHSTKINFLLLLLLLLLLNQCIGVDIASAPSIFQTVVDQNIARNGNCGLLFRRHADCFKEQKERLASGSTVATRD